MSKKSAVFADVQRLDSQALTARVDQLAARERTLVCDLLVHLAELERRELHLALGYSSLFSYCTQQLRLPKASAYRRSTAARLIRRFPEIVPYLRSGQLCLTTLCELRRVLEPGTCSDLLAQAAGKTEDEVKVLVATLRPRPPQPDLIRKRPARAAKLADSAGARVASEPPPSSGPELSASSPGPSPGTGPIPPAGAPEENAANGSALTPGTPAEPEGQASLFAPPPPPTIKPVGPNEYSLRMTVSEAFRQDLEAVKQALSHKIPDGKLQDVLRECLRVTLEAYTKKRRGSDRPRKTRRVTKDGAAASPTRHVPIAIQRRVWERDRGTCAFVGAGGKRCGSGHQVQLHHLDPFARHPIHTVDGIELRCSAHNQYEARKDFGARHMARFRRREPTPAPP